MLILRNFRRCLSTGGSLSRGVFVQGVSVQGVSNWGGEGVDLLAGICLGAFHWCIFIHSWESLSRGSLCPRLTLSGMYLSRGVSVQGNLCLGGGFCLGGVCPGGLCPGGSLSRWGSLPWRSPITLMCGWYASNWKHSCLFEFLTVGINPNLLFMKMANDML